MSVLHAVGLNFFIERFFFPIVVGMFPMKLRNEVDILIDRHPNGSHDLWSDRQSEHTVRQKGMQTDGQIERGID